MEYMHEPDNVHDSRIRMCIICIVYVIVCIIMVQQVHQARWQQDQHEVECEPSEVLLFVSQEVFGLLLHVWMQRTVAGAATLAVEDVCNSGTHVAIESECFHHNPKVHGSDLLLADFHAIYLFAFISSDQSPLCYENGSLVLEQANGFAYLSKCPFTSITSHHLSHIYWLLTLGETIRLLAIRKFAVLFAELLD